MFRLKTPSSSTRRRVASESPVASCSTGNVGSHVRTWVLLLLFSFVGTGCTTGYWVDRGRDAADVFTFGLGVGLGAKARVGPVHLGAVYNEDMGGLRGGDIYWEPFRDFDIHLLLIGSDKFNLRRGRPNRSKTYFTIQSILTFPEVTTGEGTRIASSSYYTQIECIIGIGPTLRVGFNPGELFDFVLGFVGIDFFNDDLERRPNHEP